jgi:AcrR family transcriptional regulator
MAVKKLQKRTGRPRGVDENEALERAMHVFWRKGFEGASLNDLTAAMGIQPTSLYRVFGNKRTLFQKALARYMAGPVAFVHDALNEPTAYAVANRILRRTDSAGPLWGFGLGAFIHGFVDVFLGGINSNVPMGPGAPVK